MTNKSCYYNRELSWLKFNERVLEEAGNSRVPLAERLTFISIFQTNLDEFYRVRVGTLMEQMNSKEIIRDNKTYMTSAEQVRAVLRKTRELENKKKKVYKRLMGGIENKGIRLINFNKLTKAEHRILEKYFDKEIASFLTPMIIGRQQPFPFLKDRDIYAVILLSTKYGKPKIGVVPCSNNVFKRFIEIPTRPGYYMLSEELILYFASKLFQKYTIREKALMRVTRSADIDEEAAYDEDLDYRDFMEYLVKQRKKLSPVRLELSRKLDDMAVKELCAFSHLSMEHVFVSETPLDLSFVFQLQALLRNREELFYIRRVPKLSPSLSLKGSLIAQIERKDVLLSYPFESMKPFIELLREAAEDESVVSIKMTLYRLAERSKIIEALVEAAENGKEVVVLVELRARFDEESNIEYSRALEDAGCRVIYGLENYKVHSKLCLITRKVAEGVSYITQIGTGNYNEKTSKLYTDLSLITASKEIGQEAAGVFQSLLLGETVEESRHLLVAPKCLQSKVVRMIDDEILYAKNGEAAYIGVKMNSLSDKVIINKLIEASNAGVRIELIIRGICCLVPGIKGKTENITVVSVVGRFLEHSRIYRFGAGEREKIYISSADFMTRNTVRRVEIAVPVYDEGIRNRLRHIFDIIMKDDEKGKTENANGNYIERNLDKEKLDSQEYFYEEAYIAENKKEGVN